MSTSSSVSFSPVTNNECYQQSTTCSLLGSAGMQQKLEDKMCFHTEGLGITIIQQTPLLYGPTVSSCMYISALLEA